MSRASSPAIGFIALLTLWSTEAPAQAVWGRVCANTVITGGSTPVGDALRGEGIFLDGLGRYNLNTAIGNSINLDTAIRASEYEFNYFQRDALLKALHRGAKLHKAIEAHEAMLSRIRNNPNLSDLYTGNALNEVRKQLQDPKITPSAYRFATVALPGEVVRQIPFHLAEKGATFSMERLMTRGNWPPALRGAAYERLRLAYERAIDETLYLAVEKKTSVAAVHAMRAAVRELQWALDRDPKVPQHDRDLFNPAKNHLRTLEKTTAMLPEPKVEEVLGEIERYHGTTVEDLLVFMLKNKLQFGVAEGDAEIELYRSRYASLLKEQALLLAPAGASKK